MKKLLSICLVLIMALGSAWGQVFFNEVRCNDDGDDDAEFIELVGPAGAEITGYKIIHYNGNDDQDGGLFAHTIGEFTIPNDGVVDNNGSPIGYYVFGHETVLNYDEKMNISDHLQNGPDGLVLYDDQDIILDAIAWGEGGDMTIDDPGGLSTTISSSSNNFLASLPEDPDGTAENDNSLQAPDNVYSDDGSNWEVLNATPGSLNGNQTSNDISLPVTLSSFTAKYHQDKVLIQWTTESEINNMGFNLYKGVGEKSEFIKINDDLIPGAGNSSTKTDYTFTDSEIVSGHVYYYQLESISYSNKNEKHDKISISIPDNKNIALENYKLFPASPNPCNPSTTIKIYVADNSTVNLGIYDLRGKLVRTLTNEKLQPGYHSYQWFGNDADGQMVSNGIYLCRITTKSGFNQTNKLILLK